MNAGEHVRLLVDCPGLRAGVTGRVVGRYSDDQTVVVVFGDVRVRLPPAYLEIEEPAQRDGDAVESS